MNLLKLPIQISLLFQKDRKLVFVDLLLRIIEIVPDEAALLPVFRDGAVSHLFIFITGIHIKNEHPARIQIIIDKGKNFKKIFFLKNIIHRIADGNHRTDRAIQFEFPHILHQIQDIVAALFFLLLRDLKHVAGIIHTDHVIACIRQKFGDGSCSAAKIQDQSVADPVFLQQTFDIFTPRRIIYVIHKQIIHLRKAGIAVHRIPPFSFAIVFRRFRRFS